MSNARGRPETFTPFTNECDLPILVLAHIPTLLDISDAANIICNIKRIATELGDTNSTGTAQAGTHNQPLDAHRLEAGLWSISYLNYAGTPFGPQREMPPAELHTTKP